MSTYYITTPIYYVNDRPHIGHCYTTLVADVAARYQRLFGREVFFLTGTDEHAEKVVVSAREHGKTPQEWSDLNAGEFKAAFAALGVSNDDFIRTTEPRHKDKVAQYIRELQKRGHISQGDYTGWYDPGQEEYVTETSAKEHNFLSAVSGKPLVKRTEKNYFFRLSAFEAKLLKHMDESPDFVMPSARRNEVLGRLREGLQDVPISRAVTDDPATQWGIRMPDDPGHRIYVWIDALFNYLSCVDTPERRKFWPPPVHFIGKEILWFHAVIWPAMLMALGEALPRTVYAHAYWVRDGRKMSKSLGNFIDIDLMHAYIARYGRDAMRYFLVTTGPMEATDADFSHAKYVEVFNADLANGIGNATSRVGNMIAKYFDGLCPDPKGKTQHAGYDWPSIVRGHVESAIAKADRFDIPGALAEGLALARRVDGYINATEPFKLAKKMEGDAAKRDELGAILYHCAEALRVATLILSPAIPEAAAKVWVNWSCPAVNFHEGHALNHAAAWGGHHSLRPGLPLGKGEVLFMRADPAEPAPVAQPVTP